MTEQGSITATLDEATFALVSKLAAEQGLTNEEFTAAVVRRFVSEENALREFLQQGEDDFARGDFLTHEEFVAHLRARGQKDAA
jgi:predicted transcriptional regulator